MQKKKILFVHHATGIGGAPISMINTIKDLDSSKYEVEVLLINDSEVKYLLEKESISYKVVQNLFYKKYYTFFVHIVPYNVKWYEILKFISLSIKWILSRYYFSYKVLKDFDYDILHLNSSVLTDWLCAGRKKGKTIIHIREPIANGYFGLRKAVFKYQIKKYADYIIAISKDNANRLNLPDKTQIIYNFTDIPLEDDIPTSKYDATKVLYLGGADKIKGFFTVVDSLDYIHKDIKIIFCGNYPIPKEINSIKSRCKYLIKKILPHYIKTSKALKKIQNHPNAIFIGLTNDVKGNLLESAFLISPFSLEHFSRPIVEAFAYKKAAIGTDVEGMDEIINHNINGLIIGKDNPIALANAINYLYENPDIAKKMGENGYQKALKLFSPKNAHQVEKIYDIL